MDFIETVKEVIEKEKITKRSVAKEAGISESDFYGLLSGKKSCDIKTAEKICGVLGLSLAKVYR